MVLAVRCWRGERATSRSRWDEPSQSGPQPLPPLPSRRGPAPPTPARGPTVDSANTPRVPGHARLCAGGAARRPAWDRPRGFTHPCPWGPAQGPAVSSLEHLLKAGQINAVHVSPEDVAPSSPCPEIVRRLVPGHPAAHLVSTWGAACTAEGAEEGAASPPTSPRMLRGTKEEWAEGGAGGHGGPLGRPPTTLTGPPLTCRLAMHAPPPRPPAPPALPSSQHPTLCSSPIQCS